MSTGIEAPKVTFCFKSDSAIGDEPNRFVGVIDDAREYDLGSPETALENIRSRLRWNTVAQIISYGSSAILIGFGSTLLVNGFAEVTAGTNVISGYLQAAGGFVEASGGVALSGALGYICREHRNRINQLKQTLTTIKH